MRILRNLLLALLALLVIVLVVAWTFPASMAWRMAAPRLPSVQLAGIEGSVWHGQAEQLSVASVPLGALEWELHPAALLHGIAHADFAVRGDALKAHGVLWRHLDGSIVLRDVDVDLPAQALKPVLDTPALDLHGEISASIHEAVLHNAWFLALNADARWTDAALSGSAQLVLGDVLASFSRNENGQVIGEIKDAGDGPMLIDGRFEAQPGSYTLVVHLRARNPDDLATQAALQYVGQRQPDGSVVLKVTGTTQIEIPLL